MLIGCKNIFLQLVGKIEKNKTFLTVIFVGMLINVMKWEGAA